MEVQAIQSGNGASTANTDRLSEGLGGEDFFDLLITQLVNQDPLEPTSTQDLINQISSIREIELSSSLTETLKGLAKQQRFAEAPGLIGRHVAARGDTDDADAAGVQGIVVGVRYLADGSAVLQLDNGLELAADQIGRVSAPEQAADELVGKLITAIDGSNAGEPRVVRGVVTGASKGVDGRVMLELDTGESVGIDQVIGAADVTTEELSATV